MAEKTYGKALTIYYCGSEDCEEGHFFGPAVRTQYLLHYVVSGKGIYEVGHRRFPVQAGEGFLIKPGELTYYRADDQEPWHYMWVAFDGYEAADILENCGIDYTMRAENPEEFCEKLREMITAFGTQNQYLCLSLFYGMMAQLLKERPQAAGSFEKLYYEKAADYIRNNFSYPITISDVAKYVGIDRSYLYKVFVANGPLSPKQFLLEIRVKAAKNMLADRHYSLSQTALSCGFKDAPSFCNHFKKRSGKTPKQFQAEVEMNRKNV